MKTGAAKSVVLARAGDYAGRAGHHPISERIQPAGKQRARLAARAAA